MVVNGSHGSGVVVLHFFFDSSLQMNCISAGAIGEDTANGSSAR